jgi:fluoroacetyl-CoA thioesterase
MNEVIKPGITNSMQVIVTPEKTARAYCSGTLNVFATPAMIALMEQTAMESVSAFLPPGKVTVGTEVNVRHLKPTGVGSKVTITSELQGVEESKLIFSVGAWTESGQIGRGTHTRYIVDKEQFMDKII